MELSGSGYLYTLATLSMTFAGFCAIVIVLRQSIGKEIAGFDVVLTRLYLEAGLWAAAFAMLPPLLAICGLPDATACRASSAIIAIVMVAYGATYPARRHAMMAGPIPRIRWLSIVVMSAFVIAGLVGNAAGVPIKPGVGPIAFAATWTLACGATIFVLALDSLWEVSDSSASLVPGDLDRPMDKSGSGIDNK
jgi:hypothetical protein